MMQEVTIIGRIGREPQTRYTQAGQAVTSFSVATSRKWKDASGAPQELTTWFQVSAWNKLSEICQQYTHKGQLIWLKGELQPDAKTGGPKLWADQHGQPRASFQVKAQAVRFLSWKEADQADEQAMSNVRQHGNGNNNGGTPAPAAAPAPTAPRQSTRQPANDPANQTTVPYRPPANQWRQARHRSSQRHSTPAPVPQQWDSSQFAPEEIPF